MECRVNISFMTFALGCVAIYLARPFVARLKHEGGENRLNIKRENRHLFRH